MVFKKIKTKSNNEFYRSKYFYSIAIEHGVETGIFLRNPMVISDAIPIGIVSPIYFKRLYRSAKCVCLDSDGYLQRIISKGFIPYRYCKEANIYEKSTFKYADGNKLSVVNKEIFYYTYMNEIKKAIREEEK